MLDPTIHNRPFADKRDKVGMDGVPYCKPGKILMTSHGGAEDFSIFDT